MSSTADKWTQQLHKIDATRHIGQTKIYYCTLGLFWFSSTVCIRLEGRRVATEEEQGWRMHEVRPEIRKKAKVRTKMKKKWIHTCVLNIDDTKIAVLSQNWGYFSELCVELHPKKDSKCCKDNGYKNFRGTKCKGAWWHSYINIFMPV